MEGERLKGAMEDTAEMRFKEEMTVRGKSTLMLEEYKTETVSEIIGVHY